MKESEKITSIKDQRVAEARELSTAAGRRKRKKFLIEGEQALSWALDSGVHIEHVFTPDKPGLIEYIGVMRLIVSKNIPILQTTDGILKKITDTNYLIPLIGVGVLPEKENESADYGDFVLLVDGVEDHGNIGTIVRTARSFGIKTLLTSCSETDLFYRKTVDASRGKVFDIRFEQFASGSEAVSELKKRGYQVVATNPRAPVLQGAVKLEKKPLALVLGNETNGISEEILSLADITVQIPMSGPVESLNVGVAAGISVYELKIKLVIAMLVKMIRSTLGREINVSGKSIQMAMDSELKKICPFDSTQIIFMMILKCDEMMTLEQASKDTNSFGAELEALLAPLYNCGFICRHRNGGSNEIRITEKGEELLGGLWPVLEAAEEKILSGFSSKEREQLFDFLKRIQQNCSAMIEK